MKKNVLFITAFLIAAIIFNTGCGSSSSDSLNEQLDTVVTSISGYLFNDGLTNTAPSKNNVPKLSENEIEEITLEFAGIIKKATVDSDGFFRIDIKNSDVLGSEFVSLLNESPDISEISAEDMISRYSPKLKIKVKDNAVPATLALPLNMLKNKKATVLPRIVLKKEQNSFKFKVQDKNGLDIFSDGGEFIEAFSGQADMNKLALLMSKADLPEDITGDILDTAYLKQATEDTSEVIVSNDLLKDKMFFENESDNQKIIYSFSQDTFERIIYIKTGSELSETVKSYKITGTYTVSDTGLMKLVNEKIDNVDFASVSDAVKDELDISDSQEVNVYSNNSGIRVTDSENTFFLKSIAKINNTDLKTGLFSPQNILKQEKYKNVIVLSDENSNDIIDRLNLGYIYMDIDDEPGTAGVYCLKMHIGNHRRDMYVIGDKTSNRVEFLAVEYSNDLLDDFFTDYITVIIPESLNDSDLEGKTFFVKDLSNLEKNSLYYFYDVSLSITDTESQLGFEYKEIKKIVSDKEMTSEINQKWDVNDNNIYGYGSNTSSTTYIDVCTGKTSANAEEREGSTIIFSKNLVLRELTDWNISSDITDKKYAVYNTENEIEAYFDFTSGKERFYEDYKWRDISSEVQITAGSFNFLIDTSETDIREFYRLGSDNNGNIIAVYKDVDENGNIITRNSETIGLVIFKEVTELPEDLSATKTQIENLLSGKTFVNEFNSDASYGGIVTFNSDGTYNIVGQGVSYDTEFTIDSGETTFYFEEFVDMKTETGTWTVQNNGKVILNNDESDSFEVMIDSVTSDSIALDGNNKRFLFLSEKQNTTLSDFEDKKIEFVKLNKDEEKEFMITMLYSNSVIRIMPQASDTSLEYIYFGIEGNTVNLKIYPTGSDVTRVFKFYKSRSGFIYVEYYEGNVLKSVRFIHFIPDIKVKE